MKNRFVNDDFDFVPFGSTWGLSALPCYPAAERVGVVLSTFSNGIEAMTTAGLCELPLQILHCVPSGEEQTAFLEQIDGQLALLRFSP